MEKCYIRTAAFDLTTNASLAYMGIVEIIPSSIEWIPANSILLGKKKYAV